MRLFLSGTTPITTKRNLKLSGANIYVHMMLADLDDVDHLANLVPGELVDVEAELPILVIAHGDGHVLLVRLVVQA